MDAVTYVMARKSQGDSVALKRDVFGNYWAVVKHGWLFKTRHRVELDRDEYYRLSTVSRGARQARS